MEYLPTPLPALADVMQEGGTAGAESDATNPLYIGVIDGIDWP